MEKQAYKEAFTKEDIQENKKEAEENWLLQMPTSTSESD
jgi:hypothetical protein